MKNFIYMLFFFLFSIFLLGCQNNEDKIQEAKKLNGLNLDHIIQNLVLDQKATFSAPDPMMVQKAFEPCKLDSSKKFIFEANCIVYENENYLVNDNIDQNFNLNVIVQGSRSMIDYVQFNATLPNRIHQALSGKNYQKEKLSCEGIGSWEINKISLSGKKDFNIATDKSFGSGGEWGTLRIYLNGFDLERICDDLVYELIPSDDEFAVPQTITEEIEEPIIREKSNSAYKLSEEELANLPEHLIKNKNKSNNALLEIKKLGHIWEPELAECDTAFEFGVDELPYEARLLNLYLSARMAIDYYIYNRMPRNLNEELYTGLKNEFRIKNGISAANNEVSKKVVPIIQKCFKRFSPLLRNMIIEGKLDKGAFERIPFNSKAKSSFSIPSVDDISTLEVGGVLGGAQSSSPEQKTADTRMQTLCSDNCSPFEEAGQCAGYIETASITGNSIKNKYMNSMEKFMYQNPAIPIAYNNHVKACYKNGVEFRDIFQCLDSRIKDKDISSYWKNFILTKEKSFAYFTKGKEYLALELLMGLACK